MSGRSVLRKFRRSHILMRKRIAEVPSWLALLEKHSQQLEKGVAGNRSRCKLLLLLGFRSSDRGFCFALRSRRLQVQILSRILFQSLTHSHRGWVALRPPVGRPATHPRSFPPQVLDRQVPHSLPPSLAIDPDEVAMSPLARFISFDLAADGRGETKWLWHDQFAAGNS
jgi:hypothetical protein